MPRLGRIGLLLAIVLSASALGLYVWLRPEPIPEQLPPPSVRAGGLELPGDPPLRLADLRGTPSVFIVAGPFSAESTEGQRIDRALGRWVLPDSTQAFVIGDLVGLGLLRGKVDELLARLAPEMRFRMVPDYEGAFADAFGLPHGHHGLVVLNPQGEPIFRKSGDLSVQDVETVRHLLGANEPAVGPPLRSLPSALTKDACDAMPCAFVLAARAVKRTEIPGIEGGFEGEREARFAQMRDPDIRLLRTLWNARTPDVAPTFVGMIGTVDASLQTEPGYANWQTISPSDEATLRAALSISAETSALVIVHKGHVVMHETGVIPLYKWGRVADLLAIEINDRNPPKG